MISAVSCDERQETTETVTETEIVTETETETDTEPEQTETINEIDLPLPEKSSVLSYDLAVKLIQFCSDFSENATKSDLQLSGFEPLFSKNYDKSVNDMSHTSAFTVARGRYNGKNAYVIVVRGTSGGEWYSNFDFAPSHDNNTQFAENFYLAANDVFLSVKETFDNDPDSYKIICGHSRGAAVSNLLGVMLDNVYDEYSIYVYTFATPNTVRDKEAEKEYENIFNFINPADVVTYVPVEAHGYKRAGTDIVLSDDASADTVIQKLGALANIAPDIRSYYEDKHSLTQKGLSDDGMSVFDVLKYLASLFSANLKETDLSALSIISQESDLYPVLDIVNEFNDTSDAMRILNEHTTLKYASLIKQKIISE